MNECSFSVNYDKTVFILIHVRRAEGSRAQRLRMGLRTGSAVRCGYGGSSRPRVTAASGSILTVGGGAAGGGSGSGSGSGGAVFLRHGSERDDGDGDVE
ncbi:hypothetical protein EVAR_52542_1 [Eumeta japonica]|uniref:Uncharacterized protein n=1 Tax=Eumeta variegata TaxID=151549 RepID=A0A4C1ZQ71_EUMVA|nr:hypothetical protein EVAR_52542_1 [Eumeta japonica]